MQLSINLMQWCCNSQREVNTLTYMEEAALSLKKNYECSYNVAETVN